MSFKDFWALVVDDMRRHPAEAVIGSLIIGLLILNYLDGGF